MKKAKNKNLRRTLGFAALAVLVAVLAAMPLLAAENAPPEEYPLSILSARAENRELQHYISAGGALTTQEGQSITIPTGVKLAEFLAENGDFLRAGDPIARVDRVTVMEAIAQTQEELAALEKQLESARSDATYATLRCPGGLVKAVYAAPGDLAVDVMLEHGCLAVISLDSRMVLEIPARCELLAGDPVTVTVEGTTVTGSVKKNQEGILAVTIPDSGFPVGTIAQVRQGETLLGEGALEIHAPWHAVSYSGTVGSLSAREGQTLYKNAPVLTLTDLGYSAEYRSLAAQHREKEERMLELFRLYQNLTLTAPCDGVVTGIDENSVHLLSAGGDWQVTLLTNAPDGKDDAGYYHFVGQVLAFGTDGKAILRVNPQFLSVSDYTDTSGVPKDTAAMTAQVETYLSAPVYQWVGEKEEGEETTPSASEPPATGGEDTPTTGDSDAPTTGDTDAPTTGESDTPTTGENDTPTTGGNDTPTTGEDDGDRENDGWEVSGCVPGDILLFAGDASGNIVWMIRVGSAPVPGSSGTGTKPGAGFGQITIPSFGGISGYSGAAGAGAGQGQQEVAVPDTVEVAVVTPRDTMTLDIAIDELDLHYVQPDRTVTILVDALVGRSFEGTVTNIGQTGTNNGGSSKFTVTVTLDYHEDMLPGMSAAVTIPLGSQEGVAVPLAALYQDGSRSLVYTALSEENGEPTAPVEVKTGLSDGEYVHVTGLEAGTEVYYGYYEALPAEPSRPAGRAADSHEVRR